MAQKNPHPKPHGSSDIKEVLSRGNKKDHTGRNYLG